MKHFKFRTLARRYATAIFDLAMDEGSVGKVQDELNLFGEAFSKIPMLPSILEDDEIAINTKKLLIDKIASSLSLSKLSVNSIHLLVEKRRIGIFDAVLSYYKDMADAFERIARAEARVADKNLAAIFKDKIEKILSDVLRKKTVCETVVDPSLIGGAVVKVGDISIDASISGRLEKMRQELL